MAETPNNATARVCRRFEVRGRVQGVGFRFFTRRAARRLGLCGWVRNRPDGSVESVAVGTADEVDSFESELRVGPAGSKVSSIEVSACAAESGTGNSFEIVY